MRSLPIDVSGVGDLAALTGGTELMGEFAALAGVGGIRVDSSGRVFGAVPSIKNEALIDDNGATVVFVLSKLPEEGCEEVAPSSPHHDGAERKSLLDKNVSVARPDLEARSIFVTDLPFSHDLEFLNGCSMVNAGAGSYHLLRSFRQALRRVIEEDAGLTLTIFESVDHEAIFWKICASQARLQQLAHESDYTMKYSDAAYAHVGMRVPEVDGIKVHAYGKYDAANTEAFYGFRSLDSVRLVVAELLRHVSLNALESKGVIERWFPAANYKEMRELSDEVIGFPLSSKKLLLPQENDADGFRTYFGEGIALFFNFYCTLIRSMKWPALAAILVVFIREYRPGGITLSMANTVQAVYGGVVIVWGMWFVTYAKHDVETARLRWGANGAKRVELQLASYQPKQSGRWQQGCFIVLGKVLTLLFVLVVIMTCTTVALKVQNQKVVALLQTAFTLVFSFVWGKIAKRIVQLENKRTLSAFNSALTLRLGFVKLFIFFVPLFRLAFLAPVSGRQCAKDQHVEGNITLAAEQVAAQYYSSQYRNNLAGLGVAPDSTMFLEWIETQHINPSSNTIEYFLMMLSGFDKVAEVDVTASTGAHKHLADMADLGTVDETIPCFRGCYPVKCEIDHSRSPARLQCISSCVTLLQQSLKTIYFSHTLCTLVFILVPILQVRWAAQAEIKKGGGTHAKPYSLLQYQEKCHIHAVYAYESWGGSYVEDFLEVIIGFSVLVCFSAVSPLMAIIGFVFQMCEYRLLAYRMTWVTCRPFPMSSAGLAEWLTILDVILYLATCLSSLLLLCVLRTGLDKRGPMDKLSAVVIITLGLITVKVLLRVALTEKPKDLEDADDQNHDFLEALSLLRDKQRREGPITPRAAGCGRWG